MILAGSTCFDRGIMFKGLEHTAIASPNPERLANWYVKFLGFHINFQYEGNFFVKAPNGSVRS